jgi:hypothetical protein
VHLSGVDNSLVAVGGRDGGCESSDGKDLVLHLEGWWWN